MKKIKALILAGGKGTRLRPLTLDTPKSLIKIKNKTMLEHLFDLFKKYGINEIILSVGYMKDKIKEYVGEGKKFNVHLEYIEEDFPLGTAGPIKKAERLLTERFFVSNGDELKDIPLEDMLREHIKNKGLVTIALTKVPNPSDYGVVNLNGNRIKEFVEKSKTFIGRAYINAGLYLMEKEIIEHIRDGYCVLEKDVFPYIAEQHKLYGYIFKGQWFDIGNIERYKEALRSWKVLDKKCQKKKKIK